jgi:hypothetical protein
LVKVEPLEGAAGVTGERREPTEAVRDAPGSAGLVINLGHDLRRQPGPGGNHLR